MLKEWKFSDSRIHEIELMLIQQINITICCVEQTWNSCVNRIVSDSKIWVNIQIACCIAFEYLCENEFVLC